jgi:hypothetical protein
VYFGSGAGHALKQGNGDALASVTLLVAAVWVGLGGLGLALGRDEGWWTLLAFLLIAAGAHINRLAGRTPGSLNFEAVQPLLWIMAHTTLLAWLKGHVHGGDQTAVKA